MPSLLATRLDREEGRRTAGGAAQASAAIRRRHVWRAAAAMGTVIRSALVRAGVDVAQATRLCLADKAAAALIALSDTPELEPGDGDSPAAARAHDRGGTDRFNTKILALARGFADAPPPDFAKASFAELFAWSLTQPPAE